MLVLGIESSCDDTSVAVVSDNRQILANVIFSQEIHNLFGGVVPEIAARKHVDNIDLTYEVALQKANVSINDIDVIAATCGPGLIGGVIVGATFGKVIAVTTNKPFYAINHIEGHALSARLIYPELEFPYLLLLASGGHCVICVVRGVTDFEILGSTIDDSVGETFDKVAKMLGLKYPGGPEIEKHAKNGNANRYILPHPLCNKSTCDMSFSGLKTAVRNIIMADDFKNSDVDDMCASFQKTLCEVLLKKCSLALNTEHVESIVVSGGVAANMALRTTLEMLAKENGIKFFAPPISICTDNAAMIAWDCIERISAGFSSNSINFRPTPRWKLGETLKQ